MKIKKLEIKNIASISEACIDFTAEPLQSSSIFLICGETGSGKSTILDAICLALYNKTPRLSNANASEETRYTEGDQQIDIKSVNQLLKKGEKEGYIKLSFIGADGVTEYLAEWTCRVNKNGKLEQEAWSITDCRSGVVDTKRGAQRANSMAEIIGMDYDEFCRTSMLAQGQFTLFLKADGRERSSILEKITGTEIYAKIGSRIHDKSLEASNALKAANNEVDSVDLLSEEKRAEYQEEFDSIKKEIEKAQASIQLLEALVKLLEEIENADKIIQESESNLESAKSTFTDLVSDLAYKNEELLQKEAESKKVSAFIEEQSHRATMYENVQNIIAQLGNISNQRKEIKSQQERIAIDNKRLEELNAILLELNERKGEAEAWLKSKQQAITDANNEKNALNPQAVEQERGQIDRESTLLSHAKLDNERFSQIEESLTSLKQEGERIKAGIAEKEGELQQLQQNVDAAQIEYNELNEVYKKQAQVLDDATVRVREWIRETEAEVCPVCHAKIQELLTTRQEEDLLRPQKERVDSKKAILDELKTELSTKQAILLADKKRQKEIESQINEKENNLNSLRLEYVQKYAGLGINEGESNISDILTSHEAALKERKRVNEESIQAINSKQLIIDNLIKERDAYQREVYIPIVDKCNTNERQLTSIRGGIQTAQRLIEVAQNSENDSKSSLDSLMDNPNWMTTWEEGPEIFVESLRQDAALYNTKLGEREALGQAIDSLRADINSAQQVRDRIVIRYPLIAPEDISPSAFQGNANYEWGALESTINNSLDALERAKSLRSSNQEKLNNEFEQNNSLPQSKEGLIAQKEQITEANLVNSARSGEIGRILEEDNRNQLELKEKIAIRDEAIRQNTQWKTIDDIFGGREGYLFKKIAQGYIMQDILNHANAYLKRIAPRYELTSNPGSLIILVHDNEDGRVRSGNTLSGGESFVVSLSLALGLSSLSESRISVDTIFIDEGFGTLSQDWLNSVVSVLEKLNTTTGKHVGIISHIEDLQKRIPTVIEVKRKNATTSEVSVRG